MRLLAEEVGAGAVQGGWKILTTLICYYCYIIYILQCCLSIETWGEVDIEAREDVSLHCTELGNYETLQCDLGLCWCVHPRSVQY